MTRWGYGLVGALLVAGLLYALRDVLGPVAIAFLIAYLLDPLVDRLERWRVPRALGVSVLLALALAVLMLFLLLVLPALIRDLFALVRDLPEALRALLTHAQAWLARYDVTVPAEPAAVLAGLREELSDALPEAIGSVGTLLRAVVGQTATMIGALFGVVMIPVFAFYLLYDFDRITEAVRELVPLGWREPVVDMVREVDGILSQFLRGQLTVMVILAVLYAVSYSLVGVPFAVSIGVIGGALSFIPYVGGAAALGLAWLMVALHGGGLVQAAWVLGAYTVIQLLEGFVITPRVVGDKLGLGPVWVLFALMAGGELFGFLGVMLALPVAAVIKVFVGRGLMFYKDSAWYGADPRAAPADEVDGSG